MVKIETTDQVINDPVIQNETDKIEQLQAQIDSLTKLVWQTQDKLEENKPFDTKRSDAEKKQFAFSFMIYTDIKTGEEYPVTSFKMSKDLVFGGQANQRIEINYMVNWKETKKDMDIRDFTYSLKKSKKIIAKKLTNLNWTPVMIIKDIKASDVLDWVYLIKPQDDKGEYSNEFYVTLDYKWQELTILSTYLN